jgi:hypothetical protein
MSKLSWEGALSEHYAICFTSAVTVVNGVFRANR